MSYCHEDDCGEELHVMRADAEYCSSACRQRAYRKRKRLLAPYGGDAQAALDHAITRFDIVTATRPPIRNDVGVTADDTSSRNAGDLA